MLSPTCGISAASSSSRGSASSSRPKLGEAPRLAEQRTCEIADVLAPAGDRERLDRELEGALGVVVEVPEEAGPLQAEQERRLVARGAQRREPRLDQRLPLGGDSDHQGGERAQQRGQPAGRAGDPDAVEHDAELGERVA